MAVPGANFARTSAMVVKRGHSEGLGELNVVDCINARATWVMPSTKVALGTILCCLPCMAHELTMSRGIDKAFISPCEIHDASLRIASLGEAQYGHEDWIDHHLSGICALRSLSSLSLFLQSCKSLIRSKYYCLTNGLILFSRMRMVLKSKAVALLPGTLEMREVCPARFKNFRSSYNN